MTTLAVLKAGRALIADEKKWTRDEYALDRYGRSIEPHFKRAVCFCSAGSLSHVTGIPIGKIEARNPAWQLLDDETQNISEFNDTHTHAEVLAAWDRAIASLETQGENQ